MSNSDPTSRAPVALPLYQFAHGMDEWVSIPLGFGLA